MLLANNVPLLVAEPEQPTFQKQRTIRSTKRRLFSSVVWKTSYIELEDTIGTTLAASHVLKSPAL
jgi:hypothetical protein